MPGGPRELAEHCLHVNPNARPVKQGLRKFHDDRRKAIGEEVARLLAADFIKEVFHPEWVANPVLVPKKTGELRMCIDFTAVLGPSRGKRGGGRRARPGTTSPSGGESGA